MLTGIRYVLDPRNNKIQDLGPLAGMTALKNLIVTGNPYKDDTVLTKLKEGGCSVSR